MNIATLTEDFKNKFYKEILKFFIIYNKLCFYKNKQGFLIDLYEYSDIIKTIGNYIITTYTRTGWKQSKITLSDNDCVDLSMFNNTEYEDSVHDFFISMENAFYTNVDNEVYAYLESTDNFTEEEKILCTEFFKILSSVTKNIQIEAFTNPSEKIGSSSKIPDEPLFREYVAMISADQKKYLKIERFDKVLKEITKNKKQVTIFFNDLQ